MPRNLLVKQSNMLCRLSNIKRNVEESHVLVNCVLLNGNSRLDDCESLQAVACSNVETSRMGHSRVLNVIVDAWIGLNWIGLDWIPALTDGLNDFDYLNGLMDLMEWMHGLFQNEGRWQMAERRLRSVSMNVPHTLLLLYRVQYTTPIIISLLRLAS